MSKSDMENKPGVSVVIPTYNYAAYVGCAIESVLKQTYSNVEILVIDDGSTDDTPEVVAKFGDRVRYIRQSNAGLPAARNAGIKAATAEYVAFLDSDDEWRPTLVECAMRTFARLPAEFGLVAAQSRYMNKEGVLLAEMKNVMRLEGEVMVGDVLIISRFFPSSVVARKQVLVDAGLFDTTLRSSEDRDMWIRLGARYRMYLQPEALVRIRKHGGNMSMHADRMKENIRIVILKAYRSRVVPGASPEFWLKAWAVYYYQTSLMYLGACRYFQALKDILKSFMCWPLPVPPRQINATKSLVRVRTLVRIFRFWNRPKAVEDSALKPETNQAS